MIEEISHYKIIKKIGAGGMGAVYLAEDTKLTRKVALKILPDEFAGNRKRLNRFLQEARLAANLNHPHICTIYEINAENEPPFLTMELVEGWTLAEKLESEPLELGEILNIASQIADALDEAHRANIIHRDIKSSNIIVNRRGQVKILDFGLAKIISDEVSDEDVTRAKTEDGMLVGTVQYMSPEHALGKKLDGRTDLWSLGVLLYEMTTGELPFKAQTHAGTFDQILHKQPDLPGDLNASIPPEFETIIFKLLEKDRSFRYQTASDLLADLKRLRRKLGEISDSADSVQIPTKEIRPDRQTLFLPRPTNTEIAKKPIWPRLLLVLTSLAVLSGLGLAVWRYSPAVKNPDGFENAEVSRQTSLGKVVDAVISPDAQYIVYVTDEGARQSLWLKQMATGSIVQTVAPSENVYQGIAISPDNNWVYFNVWDRKSVGQIFRVPALGGTPQKIVHDCMPGVSVNPDGSRLTFVRSDDVNRRFLILTIDVNGTDEREVVSLPETFAYTPVWSPDGKTIAFGIFGAVKDKRFPQIVEIPADGGALKIIWQDENNQFQPNRFVWLPDKKGLFVTLSNSREFQTQLWQIDYVSGQLSQITKDLNGYGSPSVSADGKSLLMIQQDFLLSVWNVPADNTSQARRITDGKTEGIGLSWTPDDRIVYGSIVTGKGEIWIMNADGSNKRQMTSDNVQKLMPCVTGDGQYIFYNLYGNERGGAGRMDIDGKNPTALDGKWDVYCSSAASKILYFTEVGQGRAGLFRSTSEFADSKMVTDKLLVNLTFSPDGQKLAYIFWEQEKRLHAGEVVSLTDGSVKEFQFPPTAVQKYSHGQFVIRFTPDGKNLSFVNDENGYSNVWLLPLNGEKPKRITNFNDNFVFTYEWSKDGKNLAVTRGTLTSDAVLFKTK